MTVPSADRQDDYTGDGSNTQFSYTFRIDNSSHLLVTLTDASGAVTTLNEGPDYSVSGVGVSTGGSVTTTVAPANGVAVRLERVRPYTQDLDLRNQGQFFPQDLETGIDAIVHMVQQLVDVVTAVSTLGGQLPEYTLSTRPTPSSSWSRKFISIAREVGPPATPAMLQYCIENGDGTFQWTTIATGGF